MPARKLFFTLLGSSVLVAASGLSAAAQTVTTTQTTQSQQALQETQDSRTIYSVGNSNLNVMQLIHNANLLNGRSPEQFNNDQTESLNEVVLQFRAQQRKQGVTSPSGLEPKSKPIQ
jgi:hypothetical protein